MTASGYRIHLIMAVCYVTCSPAEQLIESLEVRPLLSVDCEKFEPVVLHSSCLKPSHSLAYRHSCLVGSMLLCRLLGSMVSSSWTACHTLMSCMASCPIAPWWSGATCLSVVVFELLRVLQSHAFLIWVDEVFPSLSKSSFSSLKWSLTNCVASSFAVMAAAVPAVCLYGPVPFHVLLLLECSYGVLVHELVWLLSDNPRHGCLDCVQGVLCRCRRSRVGYCVVRSSVPVRLLALCIGLLVVEISGTITVLLSSVLPRVTYWSW